MSFGCDVDAGSSDTTVTTLVSFFLDLTVVMALSSDVVVDFASVDIGLISLGVGVIPAMGNQAE